MSRRKFIILGSIAAIGSLFLEKYSWSQEKIPLLKPENFGLKKAFLNESEFFSFSKFLMNDTNLDENVSKKIYSFLKGSKIEIYNLYEYIRNQPSINSSALKVYLLKNKKSLKVYSQIGKAWYTGVLTIGKVSMRFSYFDAYMFRMIAGMAPTPGICGGATDYWSEKPNAS